MTATVYKVSGTLETLSDSATEPMGTMYHFVEIDGQRLDDVLVVAYLDGFLQQSVGKSVELALVRHRKKGRHVLCALRRPDGRIERLREAEVGTWAWCRQGTRVLLGGISGLIVAFPLLWLAIAGLLHGFVHLDNLFASSLIMSVAAAVVLFGYPLFYVPYRDVAIMRQARTALG